MRTRIPIVALLATLSLLGFGLKTDDELLQLIDRAKSAPVEQQHGLLMALQALADGVHQTPRKCR